MTQVENTETYERIAKAVQRLKAIHLDCNAHARVIADLVCEVANWQDIEHMAVHYAAIVELETEARNELRAALCR